MCEHGRRRIQSIECVCSSSKHWWLRSQCKEYGAASSSASPVRVALLLVILASRAGDACISHSGCAARKWCDDTHRCQPCAEWTNRDMGASITGTAPSTCPGLPDAIPQGCAAIHDDGHACLRDGWPFAFRGSVICLVAKAASTSYKLALLKSAGVPGFPDDEGRFSLDPHGEQLPESVDAHEWKRLVASGPAYMIVRNPFTRLLSGYIDKVERHPDPRKWPSSFTGSGGFAAFVRAVVEEPPATLNKHFALQSAQCGVDAGMRLVLAPASAPVAVQDVVHGLSPVDCAPDPPPTVARYKVLRIEEEETWYPSLVCRLQLQQAVSSGWEHTHSGCFHEVGSCGCSINCSDEGSPSCRAAAPVRTSSPIDLLLPRYYDATLFRLVANWARTDFELFRYNSRVALPPPLRNSTTASTLLRPLRYID